MSNFRSKIAAIDAKIAKLQEERAELVAKAETEVDTDSIEAGNIVAFPFGRGETRRELTGRVLGVKATEKGAKYLKVLVGDGVETELLTIPAVSVTAIGRV